VVTTAGPEAAMGAQRRDGAPGAPLDLGVAVAVTLAVLVAAAAFQWAVYAWTGHSLGDVPGRYHHWRLHGGGLPYVDAHVEYPVLIGWLSYTLARVAHSPGTFAVATGCVSAASAVGITLLLRPIGGARLWRWILGVPLFLYAFHNWDLLALLPLVAGLVLFERGRDGWAGALLGVGAAVKLFPGLVLLPLAVSRWCRGDRRGAVRLAGAGLAVVLLVDVPVYLASPRGWSFPLRFQSHRLATWESAWFWLLRFPGVHRLGLLDTPHAANLLALVGLAAGLVAVCVLAVRRDLSAYAIGAAVIGVFILTNKVLSPNYDLWLVPFFVLLPIARRTWIAFWVADAAIYTTVIGHFHGLWTNGTVNAVLPWLVAVRFAAIIAVILAATASPVGDGSAELERGDAVDPVDR
jgi:hypothetical protein